MRAWARILRILGAVLTIGAVFAGSYAIAVALREPVFASEPADLAQPELSEVESAAPPETVPEPLVSEEAAPVPATVAVDVAGEVETADPDGLFDDVPELEIPEVDLDLDLDLNLDLDLDPVFAEIEERLTTEVGVPVRLPATLDVFDETSVSANLNAVDANGYVVQVGEGPDCNGSSTCQILTFTARASNQANPTLPEGTPVPLPNDLSGVYIDSSCGADCNNAFIVWVQDGVRYSVGSRVASGPAVLDLAWQSIDTALPTPSGPEACGFGAPQHEGAVARTITTVVDEDRSMHWIGVCSALGFDIEIIESPGDLRWTDVDGDGTFDTVVTHADGTSTIFAIDANRPRAVIDTGGGRLLVGDLACVNGTRRQPVDAATGEQLDFVNTTTVRRVPIESISEVPVGDC